MNKWVKIAITVGVVLLSAVVGMQFGLMMEDGNILGEMAWECKFAGGYRDRVCHCNGKRLYDLFQRG